MHLVNQDGSINLKQKFKLDGVSARISGTESGSDWKARNAIDTIRLSTGEFKTITRADLYLFERDGRITTEYRETDEVPREIQRAGVQALLTRG